jgi:hypothetical protein
LTKVVLFYPTHHKGGLDVFEADIHRQTVKPDVIFAADEYERDASWLSISKTLNIPIFPINPSWNPGYKRNLAAAYNLAAHWTLENELDLFVSLQDYIWIPPYGIERFVGIHEQNPNALITGITHISNDPPPEDIVDIESSYTIFEHPYYDKPKDIGWRDVRLESIYSFDSEHDIFPAMPEHWEANWAAVPVSMFEKGCKWDEEYDKGIAYENIDFAKQCQKTTGCEVLIDVRNEAISLPHKKYWEHEEEEIEQYSNRWFHEAKWA